MSLFVDTGVLVAFENPRDPSHAAAVHILDSAMRGVFGRLLTSDYVLDEAVTVALARTRKPSLAIRIGNLILGAGPTGRIMGLVYVSPRHFLRAWALFSRLAGRGLSFTDCTSIELVRSMRIDEIASFDRDFDGLVARRFSAESSA